MAPVVDLNSRRTRRIVCPVGVAGDEGIAALEIPDDSCPTLAARSLIILACKRTCNGGIHAVRFQGGGAFLAKLDDLTNGRVTLTSFHRDVQSGEYDRKDLIIVGLMIEVYLWGNPAFRWVLNSSERDEQTA